MCKATQAPAWTPKLGWDPTINKRAPKPWRVKHKEEQIIETRDKPQYLDILRYLSYLQYPD